MDDHSPAGGFARRLAHLRGLLQSDPATVGDQGLKLLEEYLEYLATDSGYTQERGSIGRYTSWLRQGDRLGDDLVDRAESYAQVRNCLAHSYGLQTSPALAAEIVDFLAALIHEQANTAAQIMSAKMRTIDERAPLREARDTMLREGFGQLPVLNAANRVVALLTERDLVAADALAERGKAGKPTVGAGLSPQARRRFGFVAADAAMEAIVDALQRPGIEALIVTRDGQREQQPLGIITHADVLYRM